MFSNPMVTLLLHVFVGIAIASFIFYCHRRLDFRLRGHAVWFIVVYVSFILEAYNIFMGLLHAFPRQFTQMTAILVVLGIILTSLFLGYLLDHYTAHFRWFD